jgi:hypothetical protein
LEGAIDHASEDGEALGRSGGKIRIKRTTSNGKWDLRIYTQTIGGMMTHDAPDMKKPLRIIPEGLL